jgi:acyl dehydratase
MTTELLPMPKLFFEDFAKDQTREYGPRPVTREEIVAFAKEFDPQPIHLDEAAARASILGGLSASGWHSCAMAMRMIADGFLLEAASMGAPGVDEVRWPAPVRPGDSIMLRATVLDTRVSRSRPEMGFVTFQFELVNQSGAVVMIMTSSIMLGRRPAGAAA